MNPKGQLNGEEPEFTLPEKPPENYLSVLSVRNAQLAKQDEKNPPPKLPPLYGFCGCDCRECEYYISERVARDSTGTGCRGCRADGGDCDIRVCCLSKSIPDCGKCGQFPCPMLKKLSEEFEDENLFRMKEEEDKSSAHSYKLKKDFTLGITLGIVIGAVLSAVTGLFPQLLICGIIIGTAVPAITDSDRRS